MRKKKPAKTARIEFGAPRMPKREKRGKPPHSIRTLSVEHVSYNLESGDSATCPFIRLKGRWLARAGFTVGLRVVVTVRRGRLTIRPLK
jgi:hypothetical protein